jgi:glutathionylspermidine synthase
METVGRPDACALLPPRAHGWRLSCDTTEGTPGWTMSQQHQTDAEDVAQELEQAADEAHDALLEMADKIRAGGDVRQQRKRVVLECGRVEEIVNSVAD